jgi:hypothetical protein
MPSSPFSKGDGGIFNIEFYFGIGPWLKMNAHFIAIAILISTFTCEGVLGDCPRTGILKF